MTHSLLDSTPGLVPHDPEDWNKIRLVIADKYGYHTACKIQRRLRRWLGAEEYGGPTDNADTDVGGNPKQQKRA